MEVNRIRSLLKEGGWVVAGQLVSIAGMLALIRVITEYLGPEQFGRLALGLTVAGLVNQVVMGGVSAGIARYYSVAAEENDLVGYVRSSRHMLGYSIGIVLIIGLVLLAVLSSGGYLDWISLAVGALFFAVLNGLSTTLSGVQNAARQRAVVAIHSGMGAWLKIALAVLCVYVLGNTGVAVIVGYAISAALILMSQAMFSRSLLNLPGATSSSSGDWRSRIWAYSWPFTAWGIFSWAQQVSDRWSLQVYASVEDVGLYSVLFQLGYAPIGLVTTITMTFLGPILYQKSGNATNPERNMRVHRLAWRITLVGLVITAILTVLTVNLHEQIFGFFVAAEYATVSHFLPWMVLAGGIFSVGQLLALKLMSEMKSARMLIAKIVTASIGVILNLYGASAFGMRGVVASLVIFSCLYLAWMVWLARRPPGLKYPE